MRSLFCSVLFSLAFSSAAFAEEPSAKAWAYAAEPAFEIGSTGPAFFIIGENQGCFDDEGTWACAVFAEGRRYLTYEGSLTPFVILDILAVLPVGAMVEINGDIVEDRGDVVMSIFSQAFPFKG